MLVRVSYFALLLSAYIRVTTATSIWHVSIFEGPAPPPGKGAPIQASALRDLSFLPIQIVSIVAAYVFSVLVIGTALLFVGRRLRRAAQSSPRTLTMEMVKPQGRTQLFDPSPISHGNSPEGHVDMKNNWPSPVKELRGSSAWGSIRKNHSRQVSDSRTSIMTATTVTVDESVVEDDKAKNEVEMERLYAAVMDEDERRAKAEAEGRASQPQNPPELQHLRDSSTTASLPARTDSRGPPRVLTKSPRSSHKPTPISVESRASSRSSMASFNKKGSVRSLPISPPLSPPADYSANQSQVAAYGNTRSISPRQYTNPGPPPPVPEDLQPSREAQRAPSVQQAQQPKAKTPPVQTSRPPISSRKTPPPLALRNQAALRNASNSGLGTPPPLPTPTLSPRHHMMQMQMQGETQTQAQVQVHAQRRPPKLHLSSTSPPSPHPTQQASAARPSNITSTLPFRALQPPTTTQQTSLAASSTGFTSLADQQQLPLRSPAIKQTILERKGGYAVRSPIGSGGVPRTPYSPYMPRTPLTPMTPSRLVTREERKRREKEEGRRVLTEEDRVEEEGEMWGDVY